MTDPIKDAQKLSEGELEIVRVGSGLHTTEGPMAVVDLTENHCLILAPAECIAFALDLTKAGYNAIALSAFQQVCTQVGMPDKAIQKMMQSFAGICGRDWHAHFEAYLRSFQQQDEIPTGAYL